MSDEPFRWATGEDVFTQSVIDLRPAELLKHHADLANLYRNPNRTMSLYMQEFMMGGQERCSTDGFAPVGMFYPIVPDRARPEQITLQQGELMAKVIGHDLQQSITYQVTEEMVDIMRAVHDRTVKDVTVLQEAEMPCDAGFAWFDLAWPIIDRLGQPYYIRAVSWKYLQVIKQFPCARFTLWVHPENDPADIRAASEYISQGLLSMVHTAAVPFGVQLEVPPQDRGESYLGMVSVLWMFLQMEITSTAQPKIKNHYRKQALKSLKHDTVNVVMLRRIKHVTETADAQPVDWSCRWVVQGHYRHQAAPEHAHHAVPVGDDKHCAVCGGSTEYVRPYLKGPDGKPIRVSNSIMRLAR